jgi:hypothetical protein
MQRQTTVFYKFNVISRGQLEHRRAIPAGHLGFNGDVSQLVASAHDPGEWRIDPDNRRNGFFDWSETRCRGLGP